MRAGQNEEMSVTVHEYGIRKGRTPAADEDKSHHIIEKRFPCFHDLCGKLLSLALPNASSHHVDKANSRF